MTECQFWDPVYTPKGCSNITLLMSVITSLLHNEPSVSESCHRAHEDNIPKTFDFIVVGAGVAGTVVASRLSEDKEKNVLLVEAGPEEPTLTSVPSLAFGALNTFLDWNFKTEVEKGACLANNGICTWPRGKMIGGTGSMSGMMYTRGHREIYNKWAQDGNIGWTYWECLQFFKKAENNTNFNIIEKEYHGRDGPLTVQQFSDRPKFSDSILRAGIELGYRVGDLNGFNQTGFTIAQMMVNNGVRSITPKAYLRPSMKRKNLFVLINSTVTKIILGNISKRAIGLQYFNNKVGYKTVIAKKEVILSAGAIGSPHLLMLSGIGPKSELDKHGIPVFQDLPVGQNLHNHVSVGLSFTINDQFNYSLSEKTFSEYLEKRNGPIASTGLTQTTAFVHSTYSRNIPDIQLFFDGYLADCSSACNRRKHHKQSTSDNNKLIIGVRPTNILPKSKGSLTLKSRNPFEPPKILANYLHDQQDVNVLIEAINYTIKLSKTRELRHWNMTLFLEKESMCQNYIKLSNKYWECIIRSYTGPEHHQAGTCKMGPVKDKTAVVDPELRVHGVVNLRVIDASIFPLIPNGNPIAPIIMAAEKGAHMIKSAWQ